MTDPQLDRLSEFCTNASLLVFGAAVIPALLGELDEIAWVKILFGLFTGVLFLLVSLVLAGEVRSA